MMPQASRVTVRASTRALARPLVDIPPDHGCWNGGALGPELGVLRQAIVRVAPGAGHTDAQVAALEARLRGAGAVAVRVLPRAAAEQTTQASGPLPEARTIRQVVEARVRAAGVDGLALLVERAMAAADGVSGVVVPSASGALWVRGLRLKNWQRYRGEHRVPIQPLVYGVVASQEGVEGRSNWLGKSTLLGAVPFALYGWHERPTEDGWISRGEDDGLVELELSDGSTIERSRRRGRSTQLALRRPGRGEARQDEAQREILGLVGLSKDDFFATHYLRQKRIARLVQARPAELLETVVGWLGIGQLREAEDWLRGELDAAGAAEASARQAAERASAAAEALRVKLGDDPAGSIARAERDRDMLKAKAERLREEQGRLEQRRQDALDAAAYDRAAAKLAEVEAQLPSSKELARLKAEVERLKVEAEARVGEARVASREVEQRRLVAQGSFDGTCPVAGIGCPAKDEINGLVEQNRKRLAEARTASRDAEDAANRARDVRGEAEQRVRRAEEIGRTVAEWRREMERRKPAWDRHRAAGPVPENGAGASAAWQEAADAERRLGELRRDAANMKVLLEEAAGAGESAKHEAQRLAVARAAIGVVGRAGAQRDVAVEELARIEAGANARLRAAGVDLVVTFRWGRESTTELAVHCDGCGAAFGASRRIRSCPRCGAERGPKVDDKLELELSDRSGAAEDLAGLALQMSACAWLRRRRGSAWAAVFIDEPFGALDEANERGLAATMAAVLRAGGVEQAFVISHGRGTLDAFPGRIAVRGTRERTSRIAEVKP